MPELDVGIRCDSHVGEVFQPRCSACDQEMNAARTAPRIGECPRHPYYVCGGVYGPCARCEREGS